MPPDVLTNLAGKTIDHVDASVDGEFVVIHFTDGTIWLIVAEPQNSSGAGLKQKISWGQRKDEEAPR